MTTYEFASGGRAFSMEDGALSFVRREPVPLSARQAMVLTYLIENAGRLVSGPEIASAVWGDDAPDGAVEGAVRGLMAALGDDPDAPLFIEAPSQRGYRFVGGAQNPGANAAADAPVSGARAVLAILSDAGMTPHGASLAPALSEATSLGQERGADQTYVDAVRALRAAAGRGDRLPPVALETVIDAVGGWAA